MKKEKTTIIRPQSRGDSRFVRVLTMLVLLITAATGAWADETPLLTIENKDYKSFTSGSMTFDDKVTVTFSKLVYNDGDNWGWFGGSATSLLTVAGTNGYTITSCKFYTKNGDAQTGHTVEGESPSVCLFNGNVYIDDSKTVKIGGPGITKIEVYGAAASSGYTVSLKDGVKDADKWTVKVGDGQAQALPIGGLKGDGSETVTLQYTGRLKVKGVKATSDAAPAPGITAARAAYQGTNAPSQDWTKGDKLYVYGPGQALMGTLVAEADGAEAFMAGKLDFTKTGTTAPMKLTLSNLPLPMDYSTQDGKLSTIQSKMNYAMATATATAIDAEAGTVTLDATPTLQPQQALVKLTLQNNGGTAISPSSLTVNLDAAGGYSTINLMRYDTSNEGAGDWIYGGATYENSVITLPKAGGCGCGWSTSGWGDLTKYTGATCTFAQPVSGNCLFFVAYKKAGSEDQMYSPSSTVSDGATYAWVGIPSEATQILGIYFALNDPAQTDVKLYPSDLRLAKIGGFTISPNASEVYIPFKGTESNSELKLNATVSGTNYSYSATGINFAEGSYYEQTVQMTQQ